jgi:hypothetical protein
MTYPVAILKRKRAKGQEQRVSIVVDEGLQAQHTSYDTSEGLRVYTYPTLGAAGTHVDIAVAHGWAIESILVN